MTRRSKRGLTAVGGALERGLDARRLRNSGRRLRGRSLLGRAWLPWTRITRVATHGYQLVPADRPSFHAKLTAQWRLLGEPTFGSDGSVRGPNDFATRIWVRDAKERTYELAEAISIDHPRILRRFDDPAAIDLAGLPDEFCLKPSTGSWSQGVFVLRRSDDNHFRSLLDGSALTLDEIVSTMSALVEAGSASPTSFVEESLVDARSGEVPPDDWKLYCFYGRVGLVLQIRRTRGGSRRKYYTTGLRDLGPICMPESYDATLLPPASPERLLDLGAAVSAEFPLPFLRVDAFEHRGRTLLGETTPTPGGTRLFPPTLDTRLGQMWEDAEARLYGDLASAGFRWRALGAS